jgi:predicted DNA-binding transcriptional regulator AlpA
MSRTLPNQSNSSQLLTKPDVARLCRVSIYTVDRWTSRRIGPKFYRLNRRIVFQLRDVMEFVERHAVKPVWKAARRKSHRGSGPSK